MYTIIIKDFLTKGMKNISLLKKITHYKKLMPGKKKVLQKRTLSSAINIDDSDEENDDKKYDKSNDNDSNLDESESEEYIFDDENDDDEEIIDRYEGEDAEIKDEDVEKIVMQSLQDLDIADKKEKEEKFKNEKVFIPGDELEEGQVCTLFIY